jgi:hypothetical protein
MDPRDDLGSLAGGVDCAACGSFVPAGRIRVLARRDDIAFVEIDCGTCRSESLGIVIADDSRGDVVSSGVSYGEFDPSDEERFREALPIGQDDVALVHELLIREGLAALVGRSEPPTGLGR